MEILFDNGFTMTEKFWREEYEPVVERAGYEAANIYLMMWILANEGGQVAEDVLVRACTQSGVPWGKDRDAEPFFQELYDMGVTRITGGADELSRLCN